MTRFGRSLISFTDQMEYRYPIGNTATMEPHTEYGRPDPRRAEMAGHMLPLRKWAYMLGWTADYLEEARMADLESRHCDGDRGRAKSMAHGSFATSVEARRR
jgi:hypothetical protein